MISVLFQTESHFPASREKIVPAVEEVLSKKMTGNVEVSIVIAGDRRMRNLNKTYRHIDATTDVLSFPQHDPSQQMKQFMSPPDNVMYLGDIVVSYPQAVDEAAEENMLVDDKVIQLILHGLDHLLGIHHPE